MRTYCITVAGDNDHLHAQALEKAVEAIEKANPTNRVTSSMVVAGQVQVEASYVIVSLEASPR